MNIFLADATLGRQDISILFVSIGLLLATARILGEIAQRLRQPAVLGEILAGILLGPTLVGWLWPSFYGTIFPPHGPVAVSLEAITTVAISLFLLVAGMEVDLTTVWRQGRSALIVAVAGMILPFGLGLGAAAAAPAWFGMVEGGNKLVFVLFFATALAITALPVIAKILMDLNLYRTDLGMVVVAAAIFNDLVGWIIFAFLLGMMGQESSANGLSITQTIIATLLFAFLMLTLGRWLVDKILPWIQAHFSWPGGIIGLALAAALVCAAFTEWIGVHAIFGAFLFGIALGDTRHLRQQTRATLDQFISFFFAPLFFATIGLRVNFVSNFDLPLILVVTALGAVGKVLACGLSARWGGFKNREAWAIGFGMNARGAMEIILGLLALQAGVIGERLFVALVVMAILTSATSGYFVQLILGMKKAIRMSEYLNTGRFRLQLKATDRRSAIRELVEMACQGMENLDPTEVERRVLMREELMPNGLPNGVAIPHARVPGLKQPITAVGFSIEGIDFNARDGQPARLICLLLTPFSDHRLQLDLLADVGRTFADPKMIEKTLESTSYTEFLAVLKSEGPHAKHAAA
jgi:Kef-type K+ transport system membrane component KefB/mannitol/fructose-specific phosphotransferase system IIA component (Ntr-type)